jgi:diguanylate cyclase (GGDEF)-like protein
MTNPTRVLLVEDDELDRLITGDLLDDSADAAYEVTMVATLDDALNLLTTEDYDVCLVDYYLGPDSGIDLIDSARRNGVRVPFIVLTGSADREVDVAAMEAGAADFVPKTGLDSRVLDRSIRYACQHASLVARIEEQAETDALTGLANRASLSTRTSEALSRLGRTGGCVAILYLDLDGFKRVNDTHGHSVGDELLVEVASRLRRTCRGHDAICRIGGDEFALLAAFGDDGHSAYLMAERIVHEVAGPVTLSSGTHEITCSVGVSVCFDADTEVEALIWQADLAMYEAKSAGRNRVALFCDEMRKAVVDRIELERDLLDSLDKGLLHQVYQPIFRLSDRSIVGFEALARWMHPTRGVVSPEDFVKIAEESGAISQLGRWSIETACEAISAWPDNEGRPSFCGVNISVAELGGGSLCDFIEDVLDRTGVPAQRLTLEITEAAMMSDDDALKDLVTLRELGVGISIDDFGTGYSSLSRIHQLPLSSLKLDRSFVWSLAQPGISDIVNTVQALVNSLGVESIAEGIETEAQLGFLLRAGYSMGQGYLVSPPVSAAEAAAMLERSR